MSNRLLAPGNRGIRSPQENGSVNDRIVHPPRYAEMGGLTSAKKLGGKNTMKVKKPGQTEHA